MKRLLLIFVVLLVGVPLYAQTGNPWPYEQPELITVDRRAAEDALTRNDASEVLGIFISRRPRLPVAHFPNGNLLNEIRNALGRTEGEAVRCPRTELEKNFAGNIFPANCPEALGR